MSEEMKIGDVVGFKAGIEQRGVLRGRRVQAGQRLLVIEMWDDVTGEEYTVTQLESRCWRE